MYNSKKKIQNFFWMQELWNQITMKRFFWFVHTPNNKKRKEKGFPLSQQPKKKGQKKNLFLSHPKI